ncbi:hypothetical protein FJ364_04630 [Candidatus Dependentiae bacterium]|nr:hypothetical protein [Candidatus Dependentiae bacterium]
MSHGASLAPIENQQGCAGIHLNFNIKLMKANDAFVVHQQRTEDGRRDGIYIIDEEMDDKVVTSDSICLLMEKIENMVN